MGWQTHQRFVKPVDIGPLCFSLMNGNLFRHHLLLMSPNGKLFPKMGNTFPNGDGADPHKRDTLDQGDPI